MLAVESTNFFVRFLSFIFVYGWLYNFPLFTFHDHSYSFCDSPSFSRLVNAFEGTIISAVENAVSKKINDKIIKLDSVLQSLPKEVPITSIAALNITFLDDPKLSESSLDLEIDGLLSAKDETLVSNHYNKTLQPSFSCKEVDKMVGVSLHENVLKSASTVYFEVIFYSLYFNESARELKFGSLFVWIT